MVSLIPPKVGMLDVIFSPALICLVYRFLSVYGNCFAAVPVLPDFRIYQDFVNQCCQSCCKPGRILEARLVNGLYLKLLCSLVF